MNNRWIVIAGVMVFALALAYILGTRLAGQAAAIAFGAAVGVIVGVPLGVGTAYIMLRRGISAGQMPVSQAINLTWDDLPEGTMILTLEQSEALIALLQQPQVVVQPSATSTAPLSPNDVLARPARRDRDISVVGGADLSQSLDE
jgi:hypothetical protein